MIEFKYRPDVDGLRAVAVTLVLLFHAGLGFPGGFIGVDVFFVISGFLITGLILKEQDAGTFRLARFWLRRIRRIIPAATGMVAAVLIAGFFLLLPSDYADLGKASIAQQLMLANVYFWQETGYFDGPADLKPLLHTWSLAVEEQFYLGYPFLLMFLHRFGRRASVLVLGLLAMGSLAISQHGIEHHPSATFFLLPTRAWELLIGGLLCFMPKPSFFKPWLLASLSWLSLGAILAAGWFYTPTTPFPGAAALVPCVATAVLIYANSLQLSVPAALLATRPMVTVGLMSYSLYLWHWPVLSFLRYRLGEEISVPVALVALAAASALAYVSWLLIETPIRSKEVIARPRSVFAAAAGAMVVLISIAVGIQFTGMRSRFSDEFLAIVETPYAGHPWGAREDEKGGWQLPIIGDREQTRAPRFVLWGDSYAKCLAELVDEVASRHKVKGFDAGLGGTPPLLGSWTGTEDARKADSFNKCVLERSDAENVEWLILFAAWDIHADGMSKLRDKQGGTSYEAFRRGFARTVAAAEKAGIKVAVVLQPPYQWEDVPVAVARNAMNDHRGSVYGISVVQHQRYQQQSRQFFESFGERILLLDPYRSCFDPSCRWSVIGKGGVPYYSDAGHPSRAGVRVFFEYVIEQFFAEAFNEVS